MIHPHHCQMQAPESSSIPLSSKTRQPAPHEAPPAFRRPARVGGSRTSIFAKKRYIFAASRAELAHLRTKCGGKKRALQPRHALVPWCTGWDNSGWCTAVPVPGRGRPPRHHCLAEGGEAPRLRTAGPSGELTLPGHADGDPEHNDSSGMRRFSSPWKAGVTSPALPRGKGRRGGRCPPALADERGAAGPVRGAGGAADEAHHWEPVEESSAQNGFDRGSANQRSLTCEQEGGSQQHGPWEQLAGHGPARGNAGLFPCRRRRGRGRGAGWAPTGSPRSRALPAVEEITAKRGAESASSSPRVLPARPSPARPDPRKRSIRCGSPCQLHLPRASDTRQLQPRWFITSPPLAAHPSAPPPTSSAGSTPSPGRVPRPPARPSVRPSVRRLARCRCPAGLPVPAARGPQGPGRAVPLEPVFVLLPAAAAAALPGRAAGLVPRKSSGSPRVGVKRTCDSWTKCWAVGSRSCGDLRLLRRKTLTAPRPARGCRAGYLQPSPAARSDARSARSAAHAPGARGSTPRLPWEREPRSRPLCTGPDPDQHGSQPAALRALRAGKPGRGSTG